MELLKGFVRIAVAKRLYGEWRVYFTCRTLFVVSLSRKAFGPDDSFITRDSIPLLRFPFGLYLLIPGLRGR